MTLQLLETNLIMTTNDSSAVTISIQGIPMPQGAIVNYITPEANQPKNFGNHIYIWQTTGNTVPWSKAPEGDTAVNTDSSTSTQHVAFDFEEKGYIIGYAVAPTKTAVCSTIYMPAGKQNDPTAWQYTKLGLEVVYHGTNMVQVKYTGLPAYQPSTYKNWIGIWQGGTVPYSGDAIRTVNIPNDTPSGYAIVEGVKLLIGTTYSLGYFVAQPSTGRTALAASAMFTVGESRVSAREALKH